jgi:hypothetical protein
MVLTIVALALGCCAIGFLGGLAVGYMIGRSMAIAVDDTKFLPQCIESATRQGLQVGTKAFNKGVSDCVKKKAGRKDWQTARLSIALLIDFVCGILIKNQSQHC